VNPPRHVIEKMLADGYLGELSSMVCLGAAMVIKQGLPPEVPSFGDPVTGEALPRGVEAFLQEVHAKAVAEFRTATPEELDCAIATYTAHLKAAGYSIEAGYEH
jgi:hypothetical protein